jgi:hypothetical protein
MMELQTEHPHIVQTEQAIPVIKGSRIQEHWMIDIKPRPNHAVYIQVLRNMTPEQRLLKAFELSDLARQLFLCGLRKRFPDLSPEEVDRLFRERLNQCHNWNY